MKKQNKKHQNDEKLKTKSYVLCFNFFHVILEISNCNIWAHGQFEEELWTSLTEIAPFDRICYSDVVALRFAKKCGSKKRKQ